MNKVPIKIHPYKYSLVTRLKEPHILNLLDLSKQDKFLDLGCGLGYFIQLLRKENKKLLFGLDLCFESLLSAKNSTSMKFINSDAVEIAIKDNSFDKILVSNLIEHVEDDEKLLNEISRISKDGATVVISTDCSDAPLSGSRLNRLFHDKPGIPEYHMRQGYPTKTLLDMMKKYHIWSSEVKYTTVFIGEICMEIIKLFYYFSKKDLNSQKDIEDINESLIFKIYRLFVFPVFFFISKIEEKLFSGLFKGHTIIVKGIVKKI